METWVFDIVIFICTAALLKGLYDFFFPKLNLPPGPTTVPLVGSLLFHLKSSSELEPTLRNLHAKYGPIVTLPIGSRRTIFISDNALTHKALVQNGAVFADRPEPQATITDLRTNQLYISLLFYGPTWRFLRRNLTAEMLHPSRLKHYCEARRWVLEMLISGLQSRSESGEAIQVVDQFQHAMFSLLVLMCFGDKLEEKQIQEIATIQRRLLLSFPRFSILNFLPAVGKLFFRRRWKEFYELRKTKKDILLPHITARRQIKKEIQSESNNSSKKYVVAYVDTLLDLQLPEENRKLNEGEMISLCSEFIDAGTDTTTTSLQWILANLVKQPDIQTKLFQEINGVMEEAKKEVVEEEDLEKMPYLKAVILEGLRRHPPSHLLSPHTVTRDVSFEGYVIPKNTCVNFLASMMNWNPEIWEDPMEFRPERFLSRNGNGDVVCDYDITGSKEIKMITFGAGRRMCPGFVLAILHLEYFVANLVRCFEWKGVEGEEIDLSEKQELSMVMKNPLRVHLTPRRKL